MTEHIHHLGLTVECLDEARHFFIDLLCWKIVRKDEQYPGLFVSNDKTLITLWRSQTNSPVAFNRKTNIGLHHFAIEALTEHQLYEIYKKIRESKFKIEFAPENLRNTAAKHFICYGPSRIRIEFINIEQQTAVSA